MRPRPLAKMSSSSSFRSSRKMFCWNSYGSKLVISKWMRTGVYDLPKVEKVLRRLSLLQALLIEVLDGHIIASWRVVLIVAAALLTSAPFVSVLLSTGETQSASVRRKELQRS